MRTSPSTTPETASATSGLTTIYCETLQSRTGRTSEQCSRTWHLETSRTSQSLGPASSGPEFFPDMFRRTGKLHHSQSLQPRISELVPCILDRDPSSLL